jgi:methyl-accepting chemotaxis protein
MLKSINQKAFAISAAIALLIAGCCGIGAWIALDLVNDLKQSSVSGSMVRTHMDSDMMHDALRADVLAAAVSRDPAYGISLSDVRADLAEHAARFRKNLADNLAIAETDSQKATLGKLSDPLEAYIGGAEKMVDLIGSNPDEAAKAMPAFLKQFETLEGVMEDVGGQFEAEQAAIAAAGESKGSQAPIFLFGLLVLSIALPLVIGLLVRKSLVRPLLDMAAAMQRLAGGDTSVAIPSASRKDEIGTMAVALQSFKEGMTERKRLEAEASVIHKRNEDELRRTEDAFRSAGQEQVSIIDHLAAALGSVANGDLTARISAQLSPDYQRLKDDYNNAIDKLEQAMKEITANARGIRSGTIEISTASEDLSRRTEQQAASLEETAAALDEITTTIKQAAEGAAHAREVVATADADAKKSAGVVRQAVEAMDAISQSSHQIGQIIGVIDEIAFQTNLLALNAGVEAARAGEAGRGFAVVASEVRALAQRSAEAAKEIKGLISTSANHVDHGIKLVGETGKSLERIVAQVIEINEVVVGIAAGAKEQATGLEHVNKAINEMDHVTQQNAAMVKESTAATHSLSLETSRLSELVSQFRVSGSANDDVRHELKKIAPHAFRTAPPAPAAPIAGRGETRMVVNNRRVGFEAAPHHPVAGNTAIAGATSAETDSWDEF